MSDIAEVEMNKKKYTEKHDDGSYVVKKSRRSNILAFIACLLIAFIIWAIAEGARARKPAADGGADGGDSAYSCVYTTADVA